MHKKFKNAIVILIILLSLFLPKKIPYPIKPSEPRPIKPRFQTLAVNNNIENQVDEDLAVYANTATGAQSMMLMEASTKRIIASKNAYQQLPMASTTKIVTALTVINNCDLDKVVTVDDKAVGVEGSSIYLQYGEQLTVRQLLYGLMLQSGNDCAVALAIHCGGSVAKFAQMMNDTAKSVGANNSNFTNPHGLHDKKHFTTAYDLCLISCVAMQNPTFKEIVSTKSIKMPYKNHEYNRVVVNKNRLLYSFDGCNGAKTGYTKAAGRCYVGAAERDGLQVVCVVLNCGPMFEDSARLMNYAFNNYEIKEVLPPYYYCGEVDVVKGKKSKVKLYAAEGFRHPVLKNSDEADAFETKIELPEKINAPVEKNAEIGKIKIYYKNQLIFTAKIYTMEEVKKSNWYDFLIKD